MDKYSSFWGYLRFNFNATLRKGWLHFLLFNGVLMLLMAPHHPVHILILMVINFTVVMVGSHMNGYTRGHSDAHDEFQKIVANVSDRALKKAQAEIDASKRSS